MPTAHEVWEVFKLALTTIFCCYCLARFTIYMIKDLIEGWKRKF